MAQESPSLFQVEFHDVREAGAFLAALSRFLNSPRGAEYRDQEEPVGSWVIASDPLPRRVRLVVNEAVLRATAAGFGPIPNAAAIPALPVPSRPLWSGREIPAWGIDEAIRRITGVG